MSQTGHYCCVRCGFGLRTSDAKCMGCGHTNATTSFLTGHTPVWTKDELPPHSTRILAYSPYDGMVVIDSQNFVMSDWRGRRYTHWMHLPLAPMIINSYTGERI